MDPAIYNFICNLDIDQVLDLVKLWIVSYKNGKSIHPKFTIDDILYLKNCYCKSHRIKQFFEYYKSLPADLEKEKYFENIVFHYSTIYCDKKKFFNDLYVNRHLQY